MMNAIELLELSQKDEYQGRKVEALRTGFEPLLIKNKAVLTPNGGSLDVFWCLQRSIEFEFVKEPVAFMDALYARNKEKKDIYVTREGKRRYYKAPINYGSPEDALTKEHFYEEDILKGIWYIDED